MGRAVTVIVIPGYFRYHYRNNSLKIGRLSKMLRYELYLNVMRQIILKTEDVTRRFW